MNDKRIVLVIACMASFITPFLASSVNVALPTINNDFNVPDQALLGWIVTGFLLSAAIFVVPFGRIADIFGRKKGIRARTFDYHSVIAFVQHLQQCRDAYRLACGGRPGQCHDLRDIHCHSHLRLPCPGKRQGAGHQRGHRIFGPLHGAAPGRHHHCIRRMEVHLCRDHDLCLFSNVPGAEDDQRRVALRAKGGFRHPGNNPLCSNALCPHVRADADSGYRGAYLLGLPWL